MLVRLRLSPAIVCAIVCATAQAAFASPSGVVISGFQVRGPVGGNDEYVELLNAGASNVDISGWKLQGCASGSPGTASTRVTVAANTVLVPGQYYLFTNNTASTGYSGTVTGDATYATGFTDFASSNFAGIQLLDAGNTKQDGVGSTQSPCREGTGLTTPTANGADAYARKPQDTDNNAADFNGPQAMNPHNSGGAGGGGGGPVCTQDGVRIFQIQGRGHVSPFNTQVACNVPGIVTQLATNGFYMQDGDGDGDVTTSDGIFVFTSTAPTVAVGQQVKVQGTVSEFRPGSTFGAINCPSDTDACGLTITEISGTVVVTPATGLFTNTVITPVIIGNGGRIPPNEFIDRGPASGSVETQTAGEYDVTQDGIDFYESLEGMLVQVNSLRAVGPSNANNEVWVVGDMGANASGVNARGGITLIDRGTYVDYNPERILLDVSAIGAGVPVSVGDTASSVQGALSYGFGNFRVIATALNNFTPANLARTSSTLSVGADRLRIASYNVENLDTNDNDTCDGKPDRDVADGRFTREAQQIVGALGSPDILGIEELQDNSGCANDGVVDSSATLDALINAIVIAGGPQYSYTLINPTNNADGGVPGGNIRQGILYNPARVTFVPGTAGAGDATTATAVSLDAQGKVQLTLSPGRIDPNNAAWANSRKPLAATFDFNGHRLMVIVNHFNSKGGDAPLFGRFQPGPLSTATQRAQQAQVEHDFIAQALTLDANAKVVTLGDFNAFDFEASMKTLRGEGGGSPILFDLASLLPPEERYSYVFEGNSQELDHIYVTSALLPNAEFQPVHVNAEYADQVSDHDPMIASLLLAPVAPISQAITFGALANHVFGDAPFTVSATGGASGNPVTFSTTTTAVCTTSGTDGSTVTIVGVGTCTIDADQAGNASYAAAPRVSQSFTVATASQTIAFGALANHVFGDAPFTVSATGGASGNPVTFSTTTTAVCTTSGTNGSTVTIVGVGTCMIDADQAGNANYTAAPRVSQSFTVSKGPQNILFGGFSNHVYGETPFFVSATVAAPNSGNPVVFQSQTPAVCTTTGTNGTLVTLLSTGACSIRLTVSGDANWQDSETLQGFTVTAASQAITFGAIPPHNVGDVFTVSATGGASGNPVTFASTTTTVCTTSGTNGTTVTVLTAGSCSITASQAGNANYDAATPVTQSFTTSGVLVEAHADYFSDFNADSKSDITWKNTDGSAALWLMNANTQIGGGRLFGAGTGWSMKLVADFNGDGKADIVWQHTDGRVAMWIMDGATQVGGAVILPAGTGYTPKFAGDFNNDGKADILWEHTDGSSALWLMNGTTQIGGGRLFGAGTGWTSTALADLNGDRQSDILWTHTDGRVAAWIMNGSTQVGGAVLMGAGLGWTLRITGDFNNDGKADLIWQHTDGRTAMWLMSGLTQVGGGQLLPAGTGYSVTRVGDANGDGKDDIVWQRTDGSVALWTMNGATQLGGLLLVGAGTNFKVTRMADFSGDGRKDVIMERTDGLVRMFILNGTQAFSTADILPGGFGYSLAP